MKVVFIDRGEVEIYFCEISIRILLSIQKSF
jgi:hypothetical protein